MVGLKIHQTMTVGKRKLNEPILHPERARNLFGPKRKKLYPVFFYYMDTPISSTNPLYVSDSLEGFSKWPWKKWDGVVR